MKEKGVIDITAHKCVTTASAASVSTSPINSPTSGPSRKISLKSSNKFVFKVVPPAPGTSRAVTFTPQKVHIFGAENEVDFRGWVEAFMKANIALDTNGSHPSRAELIIAPVISSSTVPLISLERAKEMKSRPPALDLTESNKGSPVLQQTSYIINFDGSAVKSPPLPTPPLAKEKSEVSENFEVEMEKALGKFVKVEGPTPEPGPENMPLEVSIPIGLH